MSKRTGYISWDAYFMGVAKISGMRSKDPHTQVGACIVDTENKIISIGYNGFPTGCSDDDYPWEKGNDDPIRNKYVYVTHAELNAILNSKANNLKDCTIYVTLFPCNECAKAIIQSGIKRIVYDCDKDADKPYTIAAKKMLISAGVEFIPYDPSDFVLSMIL